MAARPRRSLCYLRGVAGLISATVAAAFGAGLAALRDFFFLLAILSPIVVNLVMTRVRRDADPVGIFVKCKMPGCRIFDNPA
ncbi:hypothetical protein A8B82_00770 [Sulfitobacter sp. EhC04]|nr:hypothetical protein A8B82_00770 [Sulfitobacter sp. EhC04]